MYIIIRYIVNINYKNNLQVIEFKLKKMYMV
jgi:hypothetical protein